MLGKRAVTIFILTLVIAGTTTTLVHETYVVKADPLGTPNDIVNQTYRLLANVSILLTRIDANISRTNTTITNIYRGLRLMTTNGTINLANLTILLKSNATMITKINRILYCIAGNNSKGNWNLFDLAKSTLAGLITKDGRYVLNNGTLSYGSGSASLTEQLNDNDIFLGTLMVTLSNIAKNSTQAIITASDNNRDQINTNMNDVGTIFKNSIGNINNWITVLTVILISFVFYTVFLRKRLTKYSPHLKQPQCFGEPRVFDPTGECNQCRLKEDCERQIIAITANVQEPKKKKRGIGIPFIRRKEEAEEEEEYRPACYGNYLAGDSECIKCSQAKECMDETPGARPAKEKEEPQRKPASTGASDPLAGM